METPPGNCKRVTVLRARVFDLLRDEDATAHTAVDPTRIASRLGVSAIEVIDALDDLEMCCQFNANSSQ